VLRRVVSILAAFLALAASGARAQTPDSSAPTAIEQALIENACADVLPPGALDSDGFRQCLRLRLQLLRADFGVDLERLTRPERRHLDATCSTVRVAGREAYLDCLDAELRMLLRRRQPAGSAGASAAVTNTVPAPASTSPPESQPEGVPVSSSTPAGSMWIGAGVGVLLIVAALTGVHHFARARGTAPHCCRRCGADIASAGELCAACRHEAAEERRREARTGQDGHDGRNEQVRAEAKDLPETAPHGLDADDWRARQDAFEQLQREAEARRLREQEEEARQLEARREEQARAQLDAREAAFDPCAVLGIAPGATRDEIEAAYAHAKSKYDARSVAHLGYEVQKHYKAKAKAVDLAYRTLVR
jgi:DnaJ-domain-containing protein 1